MGCRTSVCLWDRRCSRHGQGGLGEKYTLIKPLFSQARPTLHSVCGFLGKQAAELAGMAHCLPQNHPLGSTQPQMTKLCGLLPAMHVAFGHNLPLPALSHHQELNSVAMSLSLDYLALVIVLPGFPFLCPFPPHHTENQDELIYCLYDLQTAHYGQDWMDTPPTVQLWDLGCY